MVLKYVAGKEINLALLKVLLDGHWTSMRRGLKAPVTAVRECPAVSGDRHEAAGVRHSGVHTGEKL